MFDVKGIPDNPAVGIVAIDGRLDASAAESLEQDINELIAGGKTSLVLDFATSTYLSSSGLRVLFSTLNLLREKRGSMMLVAVPKAVMRIFQIAGCSDLFEFHDTQEQAIANLPITI